MELKEFIEIGGFIILVAGYVSNRMHSSNIKSNCIETLKTQVKELDKKMTTMWTKHDNLDEKIGDLALKFERLDQKIADKLNGGYK